MTLRMLKDLIPKYEEVLKQRMERFAGLSHSERIEILKSDAVKGFHDFEVRANRRIDEYETFLSWLDANYPFLYEEHRHEIWSRIRG